MSTRWDVRELMEKGYKRGSILRVKMVNFLTYDLAEVFPGPRLNVILGPNGTGKSTITHAMCLACGGTPKTLARGTETKQFVKKGTPLQSECSVEVDILVGKTVTTIKRILSTTDNTNKWMINRQTSSHKAVMDIMADLSIDMENICTFMPQDKVGEFSGLDAKQTLQKTLQAIRFNETSTFADVQTQLTDVESNKMQRGTELRVQQAKRDTTRTLLDQLQAEVERMDLRRQAVQRRELFEAKLTVSEFEAASTQLTISSSAVDNANRDLALATQAIQPLELAERESRRLLSELDSVMSSTSKKTRQLETQLMQHSSAVENVDVQLSNHSAEIQNIETRRTETKAKLLNLQQVIDRDSAELDKLRNSIPDITARIKKEEQAIRDASNRIESVQAEVDEIKANGDTLEDSIRQTRHLLSGLKDEKTLFVAKLNKMTGYESDLAGQCVRAIEIVENIKRRRGFREEVVGPIAMHMNITDPACAAIFERVVSIPRLLGFIVATQEDLTLVRMEFKRANLKLNAYLIVNTEVPRVYSAEQMQYVRALGAKGTLDEEIICPDLVRAYLSSFSRIHTILWARVQANSAAFQTLTADATMNRLCRPSEAGGGLKLFIDCVNVAPGAARSRTSSSTASCQTAELIEFSGTRGYSGRLGLLRASVPNRQQLLGAAEGSNEDQRRDLEDKLARLARQQQALHAALESAQTKLRECSGELQAARSNKTKLQALLSQPESLLKKIAEMNKDKVRLESLLTTGIENEKRTHLANYESSMEQMLQLVDKANTAANNLLQNQLEGASFSRRRQRLLVRAEESLDALNAARAALEVHRVAVRNAQKLREQAQRAFAHAEESLAKLVEKKGGEDAFENFYEQVLTSVAETSIDELRSAIDRLTAQIELIVENQQVMRRHTELTQELAKVEADLILLQAAYDNAERDLANHSQDWLKRVRLLVGSLDQAFSKYMAELNYRGKVDLKETGRFSDYELVLKVGFRADGDLAVLDKHRHSGGEKSVSTIMFLMALQQMTSVPFRVVDEINQGMDMRNERLVFDRIVQSCCRSSNHVAVSGTAVSDLYSPSSVSAVASSSSISVSAEDNKPQYFLVSPKLLEGLRSMANEDVTVLLVLNGPGLRQSTFLFQQLVAAVRRRRGITDVVRSSFSDNQTPNKIPIAKENAPISKASIPVSIKSEPISTIKKVKSEPTSANKKRAYPVEVVELLDEDSGPELPPPSKRSVQQVLPSKGQPKSNPSSTSRRGGKPEVVDLSQL